MRTFNSRFIVPDAVKYIPVTVTASSQGAPSKSYPSGNAVAVNATVEPKTIRRSEPDGTIRSDTMYVVYLIDSPASLNGGLGVRTDDCFQWNGLNLIAQGQAVSEGGLDVLWRVECLLVS